jgi:O-acetyl-ADP-ribose deacetylase (regulator of RNase III)
MIQYKKGDVLEVKCEFSRIIPHVCNNKGKWGSGFVVALSKKWKEPEASYRRLAEYPLGRYQLIQVQSEPAVIVENMIAQDGFASYINPVALDYDALKSCMTDIGEWIRSVKTPFIITAPKFGAGLAGGNWVIIEKMINQIWDGIPVEIYEL